MVKGINDMASKCKKCGTTENYNFELNIGLCNPCIAKELERIKELEAESSLNLEAAAKAYTACGNYQERIEEFEAENDKFKNALLRIDNWTKAYPLDVFLKPDLKKAAKVLKAAGMTLDAISADAMRHVLDGVKDITEQALKDGD